MQVQNDVRPSGASGAAKAAPDDVLLVPLTKPLVTHKGEVRELRVNIPDFGTFIELGEIAAMIKCGETADGQPIIKADIDKEKLMRWCVRLTGIDRALLATLAPIDGYRLSLAVTKVVGIFTEGNSQGGPTS